MFRVDLFSSVLGTAGSSGSNAHWIDGTSDLSPDCEVRESGVCRSSRCPDTIDPVAEDEPDAGTVSITVTGTSETHSAELVPSANGTYPFVDFVPGGEFLGTEPVHVGASGGEIDAFSLDLTVPLILINVSNVGADGKIQASRSQGVELTWDRGTVGVQYVVQLAPGQQPAGGETFRLYCTFDSASGTGSIDPIVTSLLPVGSILDTYTVGFVEGNAGATPLFARAIMPTSTEEKDVRVVIALDE